MSSGRAGFVSEWRVPSFPILEIKTRVSLAHVQVWFAQSGHPVGP